MNVGDLTVRLVDNINDRNKHIESKISCLNESLIWSLHIDYNNNSKPLVMRGLLYDMLRGVIHTNAMPANASAIVYVAPYKSQSKTGRSKVI